MKGIEYFSKHIYMVPKHMGQGVPAALSLPPPMSCLSVSLSGFVPQGRNWAVQS